MNRLDLASLILLNLEKHFHVLKEQYIASEKAIGFFYLDDLLPSEIALKIYTSFPDSKDLVLKKSLREDKYIGVQMNLYPSILEEIIYAFQDERIVKIVGEICSIESLQPDVNLYAGGISKMEENQFLNPHLDNSHDKDRTLWRVLNLLYYTTPDWQEHYGGNLELWPNGLDHSQITITSKFNRLVVMATHNKSLHSVSPVKFNGFRSCVSNYYFSNNPLSNSDTFHVTSFRGRPENRFIDFLLKTDTKIRMSIRKIFKNGIKENPHVYKNKEAQ
ncbi:2OG-Fe(II) oxygenase [Flavobacterium sp.]|uniref:2OG-Fe(II) oxygenase n=1 Tax=Flavobacterium sp. TaxID=239 RepID=UPI003F69990D